MTHVTDQLHTALAIAALLTGGLATPPAAAAQGAVDDSARVLAVAEAALDAINRGDMIGFTDLMVDEAVSFRVTAERPGYGFRTRADTRTRTRTPTQTITERGFDATVLVSGPLAVVWLPYDLYLDGTWSHCGVDTFTLVRVADGWKIAALAWSIEQPPACARHPDGPPRP